MFTATFYLFIYSFWLNLAQAVTLVFRMFLFLSWSRYLILYCGSIIIPSTDIQFGLGLILDVLMNLSCISSDLIVFKADGYTKSLADHKHLNPKFLVGSKRNR